MKNNFQLITLDTEQWEPEQKWLNWRHELGAKLPYQCDLIHAGAPEAFKGMMQTLVNLETREAFTHLQYSGNQLRRTQEHLKDGFSDYLLAFVRHGQGSFQSGGEVHWLKSDTIYLIDTALPFSKDMYGDCQIVFVRIPRQRLQHSLPKQNLTALRSVSCASGPGMLLRNYLLMLPQAMYRTAAEATQFLFRSLNELVIACLIDAVSDFSPNPAQFEDNNYNQKLSFMRRNCVNSEFSIAHLAEHFGVSKSTVFNTFHERGTTFTRELRTLRIQLACNKLGHHRQSLTALAYECGFNGLSQFSRAFKTEMGMSPRQYHRLQFELAEGRSALDSD